MHRTGITQRLFYTTITAAGLSLLAGPAMAQSPTQAPPSSNDVQQPPLRPRQRQRQEPRQAPAETDRAPAPPTDAPPPPPPLAGPRLRGADAPGVGLPFGQTGGYADQRTNIRVYIQALRGLDLSEQQQERVRAIMRQRAEATRQMRQANPNRPDAAPPGRGPTDRPDAVPGGGPPRQGQTDRPAQRPPNRPDAAPGDQQGPPRRRFNGPPDQRSPGTPGIAPRDWQRQQHQLQPPQGPPRQRPDARPGQGPPDRPDVAPGGGMQGPPPDGMRLDRGMRPADEEYMMQIWNLLNREQKNAFEQQLQTMQRQAMIQRAQRLRSDRRDAPETDEAPGSMMTPDGQIDLPPLGELTPQEQRMIRRFRAQQQRLEETRLRGEPAPPRARDLEIPPPPPAPPAGDDDGG